jgi:hypothetical protein
MEPGEIYNGMFRHIVLTVSLTVMYMYHMSVPVCSHLDYGNGQTGARLAEHAVVSHLSQRLLLLLYLGIPVAPAFRNASESQPRPSHGKYECPKMQSRG